LAEETSPSCGADAVVSTLFINALGIILTEVAHTFIFNKQTSILEKSYDKPKVIKK